ncbi:MAG TPA: response regulator transcription factor [Terriglobales bacterium]|jgi:DNA-binding response OmpR family regulator|nr:response regulator transcription factor [Terriglobales bacterium]
MLEKILIIDDDAELCEMLSEYLHKEGFEVESVQHGIRGLERAKQGEHQLIVLDVMLPGMNGFDLLRELRASSDVPVLLLTARGDELDRIVGLEIGADDYLSKPFNARELLARIRAIGRRNAREQRGSSAPKQPVSVGDVELDPGTRTITLNGKLLEATTVEFNLLEILLRSAGNVVSRDEIATAVLGRELSPFDRSIDVHISKLRKKLGSLSNGRERIKTIRNTGYMYVSMPNVAAREKQFR